MMVIKRPIIENTVPMYDTYVRATSGGVEGTVGSGLMSYVRGKVGGRDTIKRVECVVS